MAGHTWTPRTKRSAAQRKNLALRRWLRRFQARRDDGGERWWAELDGLLRQTRLHLRAKDA